MTSGYSEFTSYLFVPAKKLYCYKGCMKSLKMKIMNYEKKRIPKTNEENELYEMRKVCYISKRHLVLIKTIKMYLNYIKK